MYTSDTYISEDIRNKTQGFKNEELYTGQK